jgi:hypothetical protein
MNVDAKKLAIAGAALFAAWKFMNAGTLKGAVMSIGAVAVAKQLPYVKDYV